MVGDELQGLLGRADAAAAQDDRARVAALIEEAVEAALELDAAAERLHRDLDAAVDSDLGAVSGLTRRLHHTYRDRERVRMALMRLRARSHELNGR
jgi:cell division septum initiation protein DivIVA